MQSSKLVIAVLLMLIASCVVVSARSPPLRRKDIIKLVSSLKFEEEVEQADSSAFSFSDGGDAIANQAIRMYGSTTVAGGRCARAVRQSIESALGISLRRTESAKNYGSSLLEAGFVIVDDAPQNGDVAIYNSIPNHPHGHIQIKTRIGWVSDFKQRDQYAGPSYRNIGARYTLYRYEA